MQKKIKSLSYKNSGVSYGSIDPFKKEAQRLAKSTAKNLNGLGEKEIAHSRGESAYVWDCGDHYRALVIEGLGTKNLVADAMEDITGRCYYESIAQDAAATILNDLVTVGAKPEVVNAYFAGDDAWFKNRQKVADLLRGWTKACNLAQATWGGGETPILNGIIQNNTIDLAGAATGVIKPKTRLVTGQKLKSGDVIVLLASSGIHANGLTLARSIARKLSKGFATRMTDRRMFGEALLAPTIIYAKFIDSLFENGININYMVNISGHGWRKIMRSPKNLSYILENLPEPQEEFIFMQKQGPISDKEAYATFNMGAGFAIFIDKAHWPKLERLATSQKVKAHKSGYVKAGPRQVIIKPKNITYKSETLDLR